MRLKVQQIILVVFFGRPMYTYVLLIYTKINLLEH
jgi:hypothetical protein